MNSTNSSKLNELENIIEKDSQNGRETIIKIQKKLSKNGFCLKSICEEVKSFKINK